jgi:hypothetical protein
MKVNDYLLVVLAKRKFARLSYIRQCEYYRLGLTIRRVLTTHAQMHANLQRDIRVEFGSKVTNQLSS